MLGLALSTSKYDHRGLHAFDGFFVPPSMIDCGEKVMYDLPIQEEGDFLQVDQIRRVAPLVVDKVVFLGHGCVVQMRQRRKVKSGEQECGKERDASLCDASGAKVGQDAKEEAKRCETHPIRRATFRTVQRFPSRLVQE